MPRDVVYKMKSSLKMTTRIDAKPRVARPRRLAVQVDQFDFLYFSVPVRHVSPIPARVPSIVVRLSAGSRKTGIEYSSVTV